MTTRPGDAETTALLGRFLLGQAYRELGAARLFEAGAQYAPDEGARQELAGHAREEREHYAAVMQVWADLAATAPAALAGLVESRLAERPLPEPEGWIDLVMARCLYDRAGFWQLREYEACAHEPYGRLARAIVADEEDHQEAGARELIALAAADPPAAQRAFERWLRPALLSFGRSRTEASVRAIALGLKRRDPAAVMADFLEDIRPTVQAAGLRFPAAADLGIDVPPEVRWG